MVVGGREKKKRVQLDGTRVFLQKAVRDVHRVVVATLSGSYCAAGWRGCLLQVYIMCGRIDALVRTSQCVQCHTGVCCALLYTRLRLRASSQALTIHVANNRIMVSITV